MALDGKLLARAKKRLDAMRAADELEMEERRQRVYGSNPHIRELDNEIRGTVIDAIGVALEKGENPVDAVEKIKDRNLALQEERESALIEAGFSKDYLTEKYRCPKCRDTGYRGTEICSCLMELYRDEQRKDLSQLLKLGEETFESFNLNYYSTEVDPATGQSPRECMELVFETCREYARTFSPRSINLFMSGGTGLGKTFLSTCIAKTVSEKGFSVVYDTSASVFSKYEVERFSRNQDEVDDAKTDIRRMETCDLLIIDDLGTELMTNFVTSTLYSLLNARLMSGRKMVINSNIPMGELGKKYSAPIMSRLMGEFLVLNFYGRDIRLIKNGL